MINQGKENLNWDTENVPRVKKGPSRPLKKAQNTEDSLILIQGMSRRNFLVLT